MKKQKYSGPYECCIWCFYRGERCDGPRTTAMSIEDWCSWLYDLKEYLGMTIAEIARGTGLSERTLERIFNGTIGQNVSRETVALVENFLIGSAGQWPCAMEIREDSDVIYMDKPETLVCLQEKSEQIKKLHDFLSTISPTIDKELLLVRKEYDDTISRLHHEVSFLRDQIYHKDQLIDSLIKKDG